MVTLDKYFLKVRSMLPNNKTFTYTEFLEDIIIHLVLEKINLIKAYSLIPFPKNSYAEFLEDMIINLIFMETQK